MSARCKAPIGQYHPEPCGDRAPYHVEARRGEYDDAGAVSVCAEHALDAFDDGAEVTGPFGHPCRVDADGELFEEQP